MHARFARWMVVLGSLLGTACEKKEGAALPSQSDPAPASSVSGVLADEASAWSRSALRSADGGASTSAASGRPGEDGVLSGATEAHRRSTLTAKVNSTVTRVFVREGDCVRSGQPLVAMDTRDFVLRTEQAEATREAAKVGVESAELDYNRIKGLLADKAVPQADYDLIDAKLRGAKANLAQAQTVVAMGKKSVSDATLVAPFSGIVTRRHINEGEYAATMPPTPLITLEEIDPIDLRIQVPSSEMERVHVGDPVRVRFPANHRELEAKIARVVPANDPRTRSFSAILELPNGDQSLRSGLYAEVRLASASASTASDSKAKRGATEPRSSR